MILLEPGQLVHDRYWVDRSAGSSGQAFAYFATDCRAEHAWERQKFLKQYHDVVADAATVTHLEAHFRALRERLGDDQHFLNLPDWVGLHAESHSIVAAYPLLEGEDLSDMLSRDLSFELIARLAVAVTRAVSALHAKSIVHLDVKPENIRVTYNKKSEQHFAHLVDLDAAQIDNIGMRDRIIGTAGYRSPEHTSPRVFGNVGSKSDVYSVGVVLAELLFRCHPFIDASDSDKAACAGHFVVPDLPFCHDGVTDIRSCLSPDPSARPSADALHRRLAEHQRNTFFPTAAHPKWRRPNGLRSPKPATATPPASPPSVERPISARYGQAPPTSARPEVAPASQQPSKTPFPGLQSGGTQNPSPPAQPRGAGEMRGEVRASAATTGGVVAAAAVAGGRRLPPSPPRLAPAPQSPQRPRSVEPRKPPLRIVHEDVKSSPTPTPWPGVVAAAILAACVLAGLMAVGPRSCASPPTLVDASIPPPPPPPPGETWYAATEVLRISEVALVFRDRVPQADRDRVMLEHLGTRGRLVTADSRVAAEIAASRGRSAELVGVERGTLTPLSVLRLEGSGAVRAAPGVRSQKVGIAFRKTIVVRFGELVAVPGNGEWANVIISRTLGGWMHVIVGMNAFPGCVPLATTADDSVPPSVTAEFHESETIAVIQSLSWDGQSVDAALVSSWSSSSDRSRVMLAIMKRDCSFDVATLADIEGRLVDRFVPATTERHGTTLLVTDAVLAGAAPGEHQWRFYGPTHTTPDVVEALMTDQSGAPQGSRVNVRVHQPQLPDHTLGYWPVVIRFPDGTFETIGWDGVAVTRGGTHGNGNTEPAANEPSDPADVPARVVPDDLSAVPADWQAQQVTASSELGAASTRESAYAAQAGIARSDADGLARSSARSVCVNMHRDAETFLARPCRYQAPEARAIYRAHARELADRCGAGDDDSLLTADGCSDEE